MCQASSALTTASVTMVPARGCQGPCPLPILAVGRRTEGRCQLFDSKVAKPVEASGAGTSRRKLGPRLRRPAKVPALTLRSTEWGRGGLATLAPPCREPPYPRQGPPPQPGPSNILKPCQTTQSVATMTMGSKPGWDQREAGGTPFPEAPGLRAPATQGNQSLVASLPSCLQPPQHQATDPLTWLSPSAVRSPQHKRRQENIPAPPGPLKVP